MTCGGGMTGRLLVLLLPVLLLLVLGLTDVNVVVPLTGVPDSDAAAASSRFDNVLSDRRFELAV